MKRSPIAVASLMLGSGFCALVYQTTWMRQFRLIFGASTLATAAVLAIFMGGLGLGSALLGRRARGGDQRRRRPPQAGAALRPEHARRGDGRAGVDVLHAGDVRQSEDAVHRRPAQSGRGDGRTRTSSR